MNRFLAETLSALNGVIAILIIVGGLYLGFTAPFGGLFSVIVGGVFGVIAAALACGVISYLALIEGHLAKMAGDRGDDFGDRLSTRKDPSL